MTIPVRVPSSSEDQPRWAVLAGIAIVCAAAGLGLARWGTYGRHDAARVAEPAQAEAHHEGARHAEAEPHAADEGAREAAPSGPSNDDVDREVGAAAEREAASIAQVEPDAIVAPEPAPHAEPDAVSDAPLALPNPRTHTVEAPHALRIVRGRVAYLRCEGVPQRRGPVPCPRDEALEAAAWAAIDGLASCAALPPREGEADLVLDFPSAHAAPELRARDTFASDVVRLDAAPVVQCLTPALSALRQTMGSSRLVASFRFVARTSIE